jgi:hypothetical protein
VQARGGLRGFFLRAAGRKTNSHSTKPPLLGATSQVAKMKERTIASMQYQLVLQFQGRDIDDLEDLMHLEDTLIVLLDERHLVEGHDFGDDTMTIFIRTEAPESAFDKIREVLHHSLLDKTLAACRRSGENDFTVIWPETYEGRFEL